MTLDFRLIKEITANYGVDKYHVPFSFLVNMMATIVNSILLHLLAHKEKNVHDRLFIVLKLLIIYLF
jgi:hypothetical protein